MKKLTAGTLFVFGFMFFSCGTNNNGADTDSESINISKRDSLREVSSVLNMVKSFYRDYLNTCDMDPPEEVKEINRLEKEHCSQKCIDWLNKAEFESDPFLDAQDCDKNWIQTLKVVPAVSTPAIDVSYDYDKGMTNKIRLYIVWENAAPKIDSLSWK